MLGHEIAHFWFGGVVRSGLDEQWPSEGFAQYMSLLIIEEYYGTEKLFTILKQYTDTLQAVELRGQEPLIDISITHPHQPMLVRCKGALVLHCLRQLVGREAFPDIDATSFCGEHLRAVRSYRWIHEENAVVVEHGGNR